MTRLERRKEQRAHFLWVQGSTCAICGRGIRLMFCHLDHDHNTGLELIVWWGLALNYLHATPQRQSDRTIVLKAGLEYA